MESYGITLDTRLDVSKPDKANYMANSVAPHKASLQFE